MDSVDPRNGERTSVARERARRRGGGRHPRWNARSVTGGDPSGAFEDDARLVRRSLMAKAERVIAGGGAARACSGVRESHSAGVTGGRGGRPRVARDRPHGRHPDATCQLRMGDGRTDAQSTVDDSCVGDAAVPRSRIHATSLHLVRPNAKLTTYLDVPVYLNRCCGSSGFCPV